MCVLEEENVEKGKKWKAKNQQQPNLPITYWNWCVSAINRVARAKRG